ncbi:hypothetical protein [Falsibacillus pallidus]|uniref:hypothetical protein n=1 Tax=Falsibacillus pallidus TaxID=493781 RepID=UPI003D959298
MDNKHVSFKESRIIQTFILIFFVGVMCSFVPRESMVMLYISLSLSILVLIIFFLLWRYNNHHSIRYFSLLSFVMLIALSFFFSMPLLRVFAGTFLMWLGFIVWVATGILSYIISEKIFLSISGSKKTKAGPIIFIVFMLLIGFGTLVVNYAHLTKQPNAIVVCIFCYLIGICLLYTSAALLTSPERADKLKRTS